MFRKAGVAALIALSLSVLTIYVVQAEGTSGDSKKPKPWDYDSWWKANGKDAILTDLDVMEAYTFDPSKGEVASIRYRMTAQGKVRIRICGKGQPHLIHRTLVHWGQRKPGAHVEKWDGKDASGNVLNPRKCSIKLKVEPDTLQIAPERAEQILNDAEHGWGHVHKLHASVSCGTFDLEITSHKSAVRVSGTIAITAELLGSFRGYADEWGHGVAWYVGEKMVQHGDIEASQLTDPQVFTLNLDTTSFENGTHAVTINICDHNDHEGIARVVLDIQNEL